jgi:hypothetical protein
MKEHNISKGNFIPVQAIRVRDMERVVSFTLFFHTPAESALGTH